MELVDLEAAQLRLEMSRSRLFNASSTQIRFETVPLRNDNGAQQVVSEIITEDKELENVLTVSQDLCHGQF